MKTAISIRDEIFEAAERTAQALGMSRSEIYSTAVKQFVDRYSGQGTTDRLNAVYEGYDSPSLHDDKPHAFQFRSLPNEDWG